MKFLGLTAREISRETETDYKVVLTVVNSELGQEVLAGMERKALQGDTQNLSKEFRGLLTRKKDLPAQMMDGYVEEPVFDEDTGKLEGTIKRRIDPALRLKAFQVTADLAGVGKNREGNDELRALQVERLAEIKSRARSLRKLAESEEANFVEVKSEDS